MKVVETAKEIQKTIEGIKSKGKTVGYVPTMGYLHDAHLSLVKKSVQENDINVASIYVNPTQFGPGEDLDIYPKNIERDLDFLKKEGVDFVFIPKDDEEIYPNGKKNELPTLPDYFYIFEGARPGDFFKGIAQVCSQLFKFIPTTRTYFGQKDYQQTMLIDWLIKTLNFDIELVVCPTVRETDGLAMSSRNEYLNEEQRKAAVIINRTLLKVQEWVKEGENNIPIIEENMKRMVQMEPLVDRINYLGIRGTKMENIQRITDEAVAFIGLSFGRAKLLDNIIISKNSELKDQRSELK